MTQLSPRLRDHHGRPYFGTKPLPEGTRVIEHPFRHAGVVHAPTPYNCFVILDEPLLHTDRITVSWEEIEVESEYHIRLATEVVERAERDRDRARQGEAAAAHRRRKRAAELMDARAELRAAKARWEIEA